MQNNGRYKRRLGNSCFSLKVRNTGIHKGRYIMQKTKQNTKELIPCLISHCAIAVKLATWLSTATLRTPNQLWSLLPDCSHHGLHPWDVAVLKAHDLKWTTLQEIKKNSAERSLSSESLLKIYHFPWRKSHVHGEFISTNGHGRIFPRKLLVHILAAWECSPPPQLQMLLHLPQSQWFQPARPHSRVLQKHGVWCCSDHLPFWHKSNLSTVHLGPSMWVSLCARTVGPPAEGPWSTLLTTSHLPVLVQHSWFFFSVPFFFLQSIARTRKKEHDSLNSKDTSNGKKQTQF